MLPLTTTSDAAHCTSNPSRDSSKCHITLDSPIIQAIDWSHDGNVIESLRASETGRIAITIFILTSGYAVNISLVELGRKGTVELHLKAKSDWSVTLDEDAELVIVWDGMLKTFFRFSQMTFARLFAMQLKDLQAFFFGHTVVNESLEQEAMDRISAARRAETLIISS